MSLDPLQNRPTPQTTYERPVLSDDAAFFGHYEPSRERVQMLLDYALAHDHDPFWRALARRLTTPGCGSPWNAAIAAAEEAGVAWDSNTRIRALVYRALYEGYVAGRRRAFPPANSSAPAVG